MMIKNGPGAHKYADREFFVRFVFPGECYGLKNCLTLEPGKVPMVEFYDLTHTEFDPFGQFVARYNIDSFARADRDGAGLDLYGGEPVWKLDGPAMAPVRATCKVLCEKLGIPPSKW